ILGANQRRQRADLYVEIALNQLNVALRERAVKALHRVGRPKEGRPNSGQIVGASLQEELEPTGGFLNKDLRIANVPVRGRITEIVISFGPTHAAQNT